MDPKTLKQLTIFCNLIKAFESCQFYKKVKRNNKEQLIVEIKNRIKFLTEIYIDKRFLDVASYMEGDWSIQLEVRSIKTNQILFYWCFNL